MNHCALLHKGRQLPIWISVHKTHFDGQIRFPFSVVSGQSRNWNPDFLVKLEFLGQAGSASTLKMSVGAPVEPECGKTGKPVFPLQLGPDPDFRIFNGTSVILRSSLIRGYPYHVCRCPGPAVIKQNGRETDFPVFPVPDPEFPGSVHPGVFLGSARTQPYPSCSWSWAGVLDSSLP